MLRPGSTIGVIGGGQLGRMLIAAGQRMGYRFIVLDPDPDCCAGPVANQHIQANYNDEAALTRFANSVDRVTLEFENIPLETLQFIAERVTVWPDPGVVGICRNRMQEKTFLKNHGFPCAPFVPVKTFEDLLAGRAAMAGELVLKTAELGYDGKGQFKLKGGESRQDLEILWETFGKKEGVLEGWIHFYCECSVIAARTAKGQKEVFPVAENWHRNHILHRSIVPARIAPKIQEAARHMALKIADSLEVVGLLAVEFFVTESGELLVNELAPRPHNSGHFTLDASVTNQFEQHIRAGCALPLGSVESLKAAVMLNLLGDLWHERDPDWQCVLKHPQAKLHLYDKGTPRRGRKMGHFTVLSKNTESLIEEAEGLYNRLEAIIM